MLTIEQCQMYLKKYDLDDEQVLAIRNALYCICENIIKNYIENASKNPN